MPKQNSSTFIGPATIAHKIFSRIANSVIDAGGSDDDLRRIETDDDLVGKIGQLIAGLKQAVVAAYMVVINYVLSLGEMIKAGKYDYVNSDITAKNFPLKGTGTVERELHLVHLNRVVSTDDALAELDRQGFRPATIEELLTFGAKNPELQREFPIVALGSVCVDRGGVRCSPYLGRFGGERRLGLSFLGDCWSGYYRFLAVRK